MGMLMGRRRRWGQMAGLMVVVRRHEGHIQRLLPCFCALACCRRCRSVGYEIADAEGQPAMSPLFERATHTQTRRCAFELSTRLGAI